MTTCGVTEKRGSEIELTSISFPRETDFYQVFQTLCPVLSSTTVSKLASLGMSLPISLRNAQDVLSVAKELRARMYAVIRSPSTVVQETVYYIETKLTEIVAMGVRDEKLASYKEIVKVCDQTVINVFSDTKGKCELIFEEFKQSVSMNSQKDTLSDETDAVQRAVVTDIVQFRTKVIQCFRDDVKALGVN